MSASAIAWFFGCSAASTGSSASFSDIAVPDAASDAGSDGVAPPATSGDGSDASTNAEATEGGQDASPDESPDAASSQAGTPGTYADWSWPADVTSLTDLDFFVTVNVDPGPTSDVFFSSQFQVAAGIGGYTGMQTNVENGKKQFLFSVWTAADAKPGSAGSFCEPFEENGAGMTCRMWYPWVAGHEYKFHLSAEGGGWLAVTVSDASGADSFDLGHVRVDPSVEALATVGTVQWTEYFEWNDPRATCRSVPFSSASFRVQGNGGAVVARSAGTSTSSACLRYSSSTVDASGTTPTAIERNGIGNSVRAQVRADGGLCLNAEGGIHEGANAILYPCGAPPTRNEAWVLADDGSLRLEGNYCLTARAGAGLTVETCVEGSVAQEWDVGGGKIASRAGGGCATSADATATGNPGLALTSCEQAMSFVLPSIP